MSWASRRQFKYFSGFVLFVAIIVFVIISPIIFKKPTCTDGKQNGDETGIDCGGSCALVCKSDISEPVILWSRSFPVVDNNYNLVAFVENRNKSSAVYSASYEFRIYDQENKLLGRREGKTFIPPNQQFAVFESRFDSGERDIKTVTFEFVGPLIWVKKDPTLQTLPIRISSIVFDNNKDTPTLSAIINNDSIYNLPEFDAIAILYDKDFNAINASKTHKDKLISNDKVPIVFTWPEVFTNIPVTQDILFQINPFSVSF
jgi:hypothetical protein